MTEPEGDDSQVVTDLPALLDIVGGKTLTDVAAFIEAECDCDDDIEVSGIGPAARDGISIRVGYSGVELDYPFTMADLWAYMDDLGATFDAARACESLAAEIEEIEGIEVVVDIDYECDPKRVSPEAGRRELDMGFIVQNVPPYPYDTEIRGTATFAEWKAARFDATYAGLDVRLHRPDGAPDSDEVTLADLRAERE